MLSSLSTYNDDTAFVFEDAFGAISDPTIGSDASSSQH